MTDKTAVVTEVTVDAVAAAVKVRAREPTIISILLTRMPVFGNHCQRPFGKQRWILSVDERTGTILFRDELNGKK